MRHGVCFALCRASAAGAGGVYPVGHFGKRAFAGIGGLIGINLRQKKRKLILRNGLPAAFFTVNHGNRLAPISLAAEYPVAELVIHLCMTDSLFFKVLNHGLFRFINGHAVLETGINHNSGGAVGICGFFYVAALDNLNYGQTELLCKLPVTGIVRRNSHNSAGAIAGKNIVGNKYGNFLAGNGVDSANAFQLHAGFVLGKLGALKVGFFRCLLLICANFVHIGKLVRPFFNYGMLRAYYHIGRAEKGVAAGGVNGKLVARRGAEIDLCAGGAAYPVDLRGLYALNVVHVRKVVNKALGILGNFEHPL